MSDQKSELDEAREDVKRLTRQIIAEWHELEQAINDFISSWIREQPNLEELGEISRSLRAERPRVMELLKEELSEVRQVQGEISRSLRAERDRARAELSEVRQVQ